MHAIVAAVARRRTTELQIRGMPVALRDRLRRRALLERVSMSQYVIERLKSDLERPTIDEWLDELHDLPKIDLEALGLSGAQLVREGREENGWIEED